MPASKKRNTCMRLIVPFTVLAGAALLAACSVTPGSQATAHEQKDCRAAAARYLKVSPDTLRPDGSGPQDEMTAAVYYINTATGRRVKCVADEDGNVTEVIQMR